MSHVEENSKYGYIALFRSIRKSWIWKNESYLKWFIDMLMEAHYKTTPDTVLIKGELFKVHRGEVIRSQRNWAKRWGVSEKRVRTFFKLLEEGAVVERKRAHNSTHLTICKYDSYQLGGRTEGAQKAHRLPTPKEDKKEKKSTATPRDFYNSELSKYSNEDHIEKYREFADFLHGSNPSFKELNTCLKFRDQVTYPQFTTVIAKAYEYKKSWKDALLDIEDWGNPKNRKMLERNIINFMKPKK